VYSRLVAIVVLLGLASCVTSPEPEAVFERRMAREAELPEPVSYVSEDGVLGLRAPAALAAPIERARGGYDISFDIGSDVPILCRVYHESLDLGAAIHRGSVGNLQLAEERLGTFEMKQVIGSDAGAIGPHPFLEIDWLYLVAEPRATGRLLLRVASVDGRGVSCKHNDLGYTESFDRVFRELVASLRYREESPSGPHYFREISTISAGTRRIGVVVRTLRRDEQGNSQVELATTTLVPKPPDEISVSDRYDFELSRPEGTVLSQASVELKNQKLTRNLRFDPEAASWHVHGVFRSAPYDERIPRDAELLSYVGRTRVLRQMIDELGAGAELTLLLWVSVRPGELLESTTTLLAARDEGSFYALVTMGPEERRVVVDPLGSVLSTDIQIGQASLRFERVFSEGEF